MYSENDYGMRHMGTIMGESPSFPGAWFVLWDNGEQNIEDGNDIAPVEERE